MTQKNITTGVLIALVLATITFAIDLESEKKKIERIAGYDYERSIQIDTYMKQVKKLSKCIDAIKEEIKQDIEIVGCDGRSFGEELNTTGSIIPVPSKGLGPEKLLGPVKISDDCYVSQTENNHVRPDRGGMFATDLACKFGAVGGKGGKAEIYVPDLRGNSISYLVEFVGYDNLLGSFIQLRAMKDGLPTDESFYLGHTETKLKKGDIVTTGIRIGQMILNGVTTGYHVHFEYRRLTPNGAWASQRYFTGQREQAIDNKRKGVTYNEWKWGDTIYATYYNLKAGQTDRSPTIGASGKDLRHVINPVALTIDVRKSLGLKWGDKIMIQDTNGKNHIVQIEDEMNSRFRNTGPSNCVKPTNGNKHCIKMDIVEQFIPSGEYKLIKKM